MPPRLFSTAAAGLLAGVGDGAPVRVALLADVHANLPALEVVLRDVGGRGVDTILHAGDIVGYNPYPDEVISRFQTQGIVSILGNHDRAVLSGDTSWFNSVAADAIDWTRERISGEGMAYLQRLAARERRFVGGKPVLMVHGSPRDDDEYIYEAEVTDELLQDLGAEILVLGHTHVPFVLRRPSVLVVNPGSVGQPRDGDPRASWALLETDGLGATLRRVGYPVGKTAEAIRSAGLPEFLAERLSLGL